MLPKFTMADKERILVIDNNDSFTFNLVQLIVENCRIPYEILRSEELKPNVTHRYSHVLISPGPGLPTDFPQMCEVIRLFGQEKDILGICLGHQAVAAVFGGTLVNMPDVKHGVSTTMHFLNDDDRLFSGVPDGSQVGLYHSWTIDRMTLPDCLEVTAEDDEGKILAMRHKTFNVRGLQFHPESFLTPVGSVILKNWLSSR
ncbi:MAG: aminodeoxychorismate/anthranilate synthase component II [Bacteroidales bacterium]|nr:aminodeoxychorismate/anthranilate synthase component II [Bacteroidales bacterium]